MGRLPPCDYESFQNQRLLNFCTRFDLPTKLQRKLVQQKTDVERIAKDMLNRPFMKPSEIYWLLGDLDNEGLLYLMTIARKKHIQKAVSLFVTTLRNVTPLINGNELKELGYRPGPGFRSMLNHLIEVQLDGQVTTHDQAMNFIISTYPSTIPGPFRHISHELFDFNLNYLILLPKAQAVLIKVCFFVLNQKVPPLGQ